MKVTPVISFQDGELENVYPHYYKTYIINKDIPFNVPGPLKLILSIGAGDFPPLQNKVMVEWASIKVFYIGHHEALLGEFPLTSHLLAELNELTEDQQGRHIRSWLPPNILQRAREEHGNASTNQWLSGLLNRAMCELAVYDGPGEPIVTHAGGKRLHVPGKTEQLRIEMTEACEQLDNNQIICRERNHETN